MPDLCIKKVLRGFIPYIKILRSELAKYPWRKSFLCKNYLIKLLNLHID